jgi:hypothetical protein
MRKITDKPTRGEVSETVNKHGEDLEKKTEELDVIASDTEVVRDTLASLEPGSGTQEGVDEVVQSINDAEDVTVEIFEEEDENLEQQQAESEEYQTDLEGREEASESDRNKITDASSRVETQATVDELANAEAAVSEDIDFLDEEIDKADEAREESEKLQSQHQNRVHGGRR